MGQSDLEVLIDMGFERARAELAVKKSGGRGFHSQIDAHLLVVLTQSSSRCPELARGESRQTPGGAPGHGGNNWWEPRRRGL
jgi:hypothetical protein